MLKSIKDAIERELTAVRDIAAKAQTEDRNLTGEERTEIDRRMKTVTDLKTRANDQDELKKQLADLGDGLEYNDDQGEKAAPAGFAARSKGPLGKQFVESAEYKALVESVPGGRFGEKSRVQSAPFGVKALVTGLSDTSAGSLITPDRMGMLDPFYQRPLTLRDLVSPGTTASDSVEFVRLVSVTNAAAPVAEATTAALPTQDGTTGALINAAGGGYKPESGMTFEKVTTNVKTIATWLPATKRSLSDAAQVQSLIDSFLVYAVEEELEDQMLAGSGVGENFDGLTGTSGVQTQIAPAGTETVLDTARMARRKVRVGGRSTPTAFVFNPIDWEGIELLKDANERYLGAGPFAPGTRTLWGLPVVESEAVTAGIGWCADWRKAMLWDREQASVQITDSHADFFVRNLVAILGELRAAFGVLRPAAFCKMTLA
jgi:HK97 family phage major capsid protein